MVRLRQVGHDTEKQKVFNLSQGLQGREEQERSSDSRQGSQLVGASELLGHRIWPQSQTGVMVVFLGSQIQFCQLQDQPSIKIYSGEVRKWPYRKRRS